MSPRPQKPVDTEEVRAFKRNHPRAVVVPGRPKEMPRWEAIDYPVGGDPRADKKRKEVQP